MSSDTLAGEASPALLIDEKIRAVGGWRGETLARLRALIHEADPAVVETVKWRKITNPLGVPVWEHDGIVCTGETYRDKVKLTFARAPPCRTRPDCSTRVWTAARAGPSTSTKAGGSTRRPSGR